MNPLTYPDPYTHRRHDRTTHAVRLIDPDLGGPHRTGYRQPRALPPGAPAEWRRNPWWARLTTTPRPVRTIRTWSPNPGHAVWTGPDIATRAGIRTTSVPAWCARRGIHPCGRDGRWLLYPTRPVRALLLERTR